MKIVRLVSLIAIASSFAVAQIPVHAAGLQQGSMAGRYEFDSGCRYHDYTGTGTMIITSTPQQWGMPGIIVLWGDTEKIAKQIKYTKGVAQISADPQYSKTYIIFGDDGGSVHLSGQLDATLFGAWLDISTRGNFDYSVGPYCTWDHQREAK